MWWGEGVKRLGKVGVVELTGERVRERVEMMVGMKAACGCIFFLLFFWKVEGWLRKLMGNEIDGVWEFLNEIEKIGMKGC